jgi:PKD repeat protein
MDNDGHLEIVAIVPWSGANPVDNLLGLYVFEHDFGGGVAAQFSVDVTYGALPLTVTFTDLSLPGSSAIVSWDWDFGDGETSTEQNPIHTYYAIGTYTVSLTVIDENGLSDTEIMENYIEVFMPDVFISVSVDSVTAFSGDTIIVPVSVVFPADSTFGSAGLSISGYQNVLEFIELDTTSTLIGSAGWMFIVNETENLIIMASAGAENISGEGVLFKLKFSVPDTISGFVPIIVVSALFDESDIP